MYACRVRGKLREEETRILNPRIFNFASLIKQLVVRFVVVAVCYRLIFFSLPDLRGREKKNLKREKLFGRNNKRKDH